MKLISWLSLRLISQTAVSNDQSKLGEIPNQWRSEHDHLRKALENDDWVKSMKKRLSN